MVSTWIRKLMSAAPSWWVNSQVASALFVPERVTVKVTDPFSAPAAVAALSQGQFSLVWHTAGKEKARARNKILSGQ
ncbi:MAG: hypothetical protein ABSE44_13545 [Candidatus Sulfotelmatobacter sp.]